VQTDRAELPDGLSELPPDARELWRQAYQAALRFHGRDPEQAGNVAWEALRTHFELGPDGKWVRKPSSPPRL